MNAVYDAEFEIRFMLENGGTVEAYGSKLTLPIERKFGDLDGVRRYVDLVWETVGASGKPPAIRPRRGDKLAHYEYFNHTIAVPEHKGVHHSWAMRECVILHECAHALVGVTGHGPQFCGTFISLLEQFIGPEVGFLMMAALSERGVQIEKTTV